MPPLNAGTVAGSATDAAVLGDDAKEDPELCAQRAREAGDGERRSRGRREPRRDTGSGVRQGRGEDDVHPCLSPEDTTAGNHLVMAAHYNEIAQSNLRSGHVATLVADPLS